MKYLITESQFDKVIFMYLDNQDFIQIERGNRIYFVNSEGDEYSQIRYDKDDGWCFIYINLIDEISSFFSLQESDSKQVIGKWVENTLQMRVTNTLLRQFQKQFLVENTLQMRVTNTDYVHLHDTYIVENTLQMRVTNTHVSVGYGHHKLRIPYE